MCHKRKLTDLGTKRKNKQTDPMTTSIVWRAAATAGDDRGSGGGRVAQHWVWDRERDDMGSNFVIRRFMAIRLSAKIKERFAVNSAR